MPHLTRLTLNIVEELESNMPALLSLTQARRLGCGWELLSLGCLGLLMSCRSASHRQAATRGVCHPCLPCRPTRFQVSELSLLGCYRASRGLAQLSNLVQLDLQPGLVMNGGWLWVNACWPVCVALGSIAGGRKGGPACFGAAAACRPAAAGAYRGWSSPPCAPLSSGHSNNHCSRQ